VQKRVAGRAGEQASQVRLGVEVEEVEVEEVEVEEVEVEVEAMPQQEDARHTQGALAQTRQCDGSLRSVSLDPHTFYWRSTRGIGGISSSLSSSSL
jgi:hypothetical protein